MSTVTTEKGKAAGAVADELVVPAQAGRADEQQQAAVEAIAAALDPLVARLAGQTRTQGV